MAQVRSRIFLICSVLAVLTVYALVAFPRSGEILHPHDPRYMDMLARAFLAGQSHLPLKPSEQLLTLADPWTPAKNNISHLHDLTYYNGEYFLYWGAVPVALFYAPYRLLTGSPLYDKWVVLFCVSVGFCVFFSVFRRILDAIAPRDERGIGRLVPWLLGAAYLGLGNGFQNLLFRPWHYEVAIACGGMFLSLSTLFLMRSLRPRAAPAADLALAGLCFGLAVGSRTTLVGFLPAILFVFALHLRRLRWSERPLRQAAVCAAALALPAGIIAALLMAYNYARFGDALEFGIHYQLNNDAMRTLVLFSPARIMENFGKYFLNRLEPALDFPFWQIVGWDSQHIGLLCLFPLTLGCLLTPPAGLVLLVPSFRRRLSARSGAALFWSWLFLATCASLSILILMAPSEPRYAADFSTFLVLSGLVPLSALYLRLPAAGPLRPVAGLLLCAVVGLGVAVQGWVVATIPGSSLAPVLFHGPQRAGDLLRTLTGLRDTLNAEVVLEFPPAPGEPPPPNEPVIAQGRTEAADSVFVRRLGPERIVVGIDHWGIPPLESPPLMIDPRYVHRLVLNLDRPAGRIGVTFDGVPVLEAALKPFPIREDRVAVGRKIPGVGPISETFGGTVRLIELRSGPAPSAP